MTITTLFFFSIDTKMEEEVKGQLSQRDPSG